jgi:histidine ammonia-lyase
MELDGNAITLQHLEKLIRCTNLKVSSGAIERVDAARDVINKIVDENQVAYGINTGFGVNSNIMVDRKDISKLQHNIILSHATGVGTPIPVNIARRMLLLRIHTLLKGHSGIRSETIQKLVDFWNAGVVSLIPSQGTVGASGDLAPLAHLALGVVGKGLIYDPKHKDYLPAQSVLLEYGLKSVVLEHKEGLALVNGTQFILAFATEAFELARRISKKAAMIAALSASALYCHIEAFDERIHKARPHPGQLKVAKEMRELLTKSTQIDKDPQDAYSIRCIPQIHGIAIDMLEQVGKILETEVNSALDNPLVFTPDPVISGGNFHGQYPAMASDMMVIALHQLGQASHARLLRLLNPTKSKGLPCFLAPNPGINSGFMTWENTAASLVAETRNMCTPCCCDTISTGADKEDHVSMGGHSARKALQAAQNVAQILAIELMAANQALHIRGSTVALSLGGRLSKVISDLDISEISQDQYCAKPYQKCLDFVQEDIKF